MNTESITQINNYNKYEIAETENYIDITGRLCYMDDYNSNGFKLLNSGNTEECVKTLITTPIVGSYSSIKDDFKGHEATKTKDGIVFKTQAVGTYINAWIKNDIVKPVFRDKEVELPCIFGTARVWKRFINFYNVIKKRLDKGEDICTSWELNPIEVKKDEDVTDKRIPNPRSCDNWEFIGNCLLGKSVTPAYGNNAKILEVSEIQFDKELSEALEEDIKSLNKQEKTNINDIIKSTVEETIKQFSSFKSNENDKIQGGNEIMAKKKIEQSALSMTDLYEKIWNALNPKGWSTIPYYSIWEVYPEDHKILCKNIDNSELEDNLTVITYTVDENENITLGEKTETKLSKVLSEQMNVNISMNLDDTAKLLSEKETNIKELSAKVENLEKELSEKVDALVKSSETVKEKETIISEKDKEISELKPFKAQVEKAEEEKRQAEISQKKEELKAMATKGGFIEEKELETSESIKIMIDNLDEKGIKAEIAERFMKTLEENTKDKTETSENHSEETANRNLEANDEESLIDPKDIMSSFLRK